MIMQRVKRETMQERAICQLCKTKTTGVRHSGWNAALARAPSVWHRRLFAHRKNYLEKTMNNEITKALHTTNEHLAQDAELDVKLFA